MIGKTISHYRILEELGRGGMGVVYKAEDTKLKREVAIKFLPHYISENEDERKRFEIEAQAAASLNHPNISTIHSIEEVENQIFIVMEYIEGEELKDKIKTGPLPVEEAINIAPQIAEGLATAHKKGIIHRDIKSQNIMITTEGKVKIMDFGLAKMRGTQITKVGTTVGTVAYMSPEQARGEEVDYRTDIWSFGVVLYEMLTGKLPFRGDYEQAVIYSVLNVEPNPLTKYRNDVPEAFELLIYKCLSKNPDDRFSSSKDLLREMLKLKAVGSNSFIQIENRSDDTKNYSVAVLDFTNISGDTSIDWLGGGIAETVTVDLKKISAVKVVSRERVSEILKNISAQKVTEENITDIGRKLKTRWVVWGGFQKLGPAIRITAHFKEISSGEIFGSAKVDGSMENIFNLQDNIITALADSLNLVITPEEKKKIEKPETLKLEAYEYYIKGRQLFNLFGRPSFDEAQALFEKAIEIDPNYALSYHGLGSIYIFRYIGQTDPRDLDIGISYLQKALELDPDIAEAYDRLTYAYTRKLKFTEAIRIGEKAIELKLDNYYTHYFLGVACMVKAAHDYETQAYIKAIDYLKKAITLQPNYEPSYLVLAGIYTIYGKYDDARKHLQTAIRIEELNLHEGVRFIGAYLLMGNLNHREKQLNAAFANYKKSLKSLEGSDHFYCKPFLAFTYIGFGNICLRNKEFDEAHKNFKAAQDVIYKNPKSLGIGYFLIYTFTGMACVFNRLLMRKDAKIYFQKALDLFNSKSGYDFNWIWEGTDAQVYYEFARYHATASEMQEAIASLKKAVQCGFLDFSLMQLEPDFAILHNSPEFKEIVTQPNQLKDFRLTINDL